jgi:hypothetical protein
VYQYVEMIPTGGGSKPAAPSRQIRNEREQTGVPALSPLAEALLERHGGDDASILREVATSAAFGAPDVSLVPTNAPTDETGQQPAGGRTGETADTSAAAPTFPESNVVVAGARIAGDLRLAGLAVMLLLITAGTAIAARFSDDPSAGRSDDPRTPPTGSAGD